MLTPADVDAASLGLRIMMLSRSQTPPSRVQEAMMGEMRRYFAGLRQSDV